MRIDLNGKTALVTGSSSGIGKAIALGLAQAGAKVVIHGRNKEKVDAAVAVLKKNGGGNPGAIIADLSSAEGAAKIAAALPNIDILVNNAGIFEPKEFFCIPDADWSRFFETNVMSGVRLARSYMKGMLERGWGRVVFISSESAIFIPKEMIHYGMTKTANLAVSLGLSELTAGTGVTVNAVLPGPTASDGVETMLAGAAAKAGISTEEAGRQFIKAARPSSLLQRLASPEEVANMVVYVCSPQASATNGAALKVEGGIVRTIY